MAADKEEQEEHALPQMPHAHQPPVPSLGDLDLDADDDDESGDASSEGLSGGGSEELEASSGEEEELQPPEPYDPAEEEAAIAQAMQEYMRATQVHTLLLCTLPALHTPCSAQLASLRSCAQLPHLSSPLLLVPLRGCERSGQTMPQTHLHQMRSKKLARKGELGYLASHCC